MKQRRMRIGLGLVVATMVALAGCGDGAGRGVSFDNPPAKGAASGDTLKQIRKRGKIIIGVKYDTPPFGFVPQGQTQPDGFDIDLAKAFAEKLGVGVEFVQVTTKNRIPNLQTGKIDMILASMIKTADREKTIDFSKVYFEDEQTLLVRANSKITGPQDLNGKTVSLAQGGFEGDNIKKVAPGVKVLAYQGWPEALQAMLRGESDAVTSTLGLLSGLAKNAREAGVDVKVVGDGFAPGPVGAGFRKGDKEIKAAFDKALVEMVKDGTYDRIFLKWWKDVLPKPYAVDTSL